MHSSSSSLRLVNGAYEGLVVTISPDIAQDNCNNILNGLKGVLSEFSSELHGITRGGVSLRKVTVELPNSWQMNDLTCTPWGPLTISSAPVAHHIQITKPHPVFGDRPWAQQSQGCGRQGDFIQLGEGLLKTFSNDSYSHAAQLLLGEWVKYRWGVFDEHGYEGDPLFPDTFRDPSNGKLRRNACLPKGSQLFYCPADSHTSEAPTKHNAQCRGRPAGDIIKQSKDFRQMQNTTVMQLPALVPSFEFIQAGPPRIVLVVEDTAVMNIQQRWEFLRKAIRRVIVYDVPEGSRVGLVVFNSAARTAISISALDSVSDVRQRIGSSLPRNPSRVPESHKCLLCGFQEALNAIDTDSHAIEGATIILMTSGPGEVPKQELEDMKKLSKERQIRVEAILYPLHDQHSTSAHSSNIEELVSVTGGSVFTVTDEGVGNDSKINMMVALMDSLLAAVRHSATASTVKAPLLIHNDNFPGGSSDMARGSFSIDDSIGPEFTFSVYYYDLNHVGNTIELTSPSEKIYTSVNMQEDGDANVIFMKLLKAERGLWRYQVENRADSHQGLHIQVTAKESSNQQISLRVWTTTFRNKISEDPKFMQTAIPVIVYAELRDGMLPILNAKVTATLTRLGTNATGSTYQPIQFTLLDNGSGDPDLTSNDGVYSRYLPQIPYQYGLQGQYKLSVNADNNKGNANEPIHLTSSEVNKRYPSLGRSTCCGSIINYDNVKPRDPFQTSEAYGVLTLNSQAVEDIVPPNRILDLRVEVNQTNRQVTLHWTTPGDNYDWGTAHHYEAVLADSWTEAKAFAGEKVNNMPMPLPAGSKQTMQVLIEKYEKNIYVAIRALDEVGNYGGVSNIATIWVPHPPVTMRTPTSPQTNHRKEASMGSTETISSGITQPVRVSGLNIDDMTIILGAVTGFLIVIAVIVTFCYLHVARKKKQQRKNESEILSEGQHTASKGNLSLPLEQYERCNSSESPIKTVEVISKDVRNLSPVPSWTASTLLQEHERRFSTTSGPLLDKAQYDNEHVNLQDPFPDVTLTGGKCQSGSQTPSTIQSDPPAYQAAYIGDAYTEHPYAYHPGYSQEELPPYSQECPSTQPSSMYFSDVPNPEMEMSYRPEGGNYHMSREFDDMSSYHHTLQGMPTYPNDMGMAYEPHRTKVPPPTAPKPRVVAQANVPDTLEDSVRRNVTQV
ncbi:unnamed protein product, partial [Meganyctiphanes norvegica]